jgi:hypothetical protein
MGRFNRCEGARSLIDGEAVWYGKDGKPDKLHTHAHDHEVILLAFDLLAVDGRITAQDCWRGARPSLGKLISGTDGIHFAEHLEADGKIVFEHTCKMGLEGIVSKRRDFPIGPAGARAGSRSRTGQCRSTAGLPLGHFSKLESHLKYILVRSLFCRARPKRFELLTPQIRNIIPCSNAPGLSNNIIHKGLAFGSDWSGNVVNSERVRALRDPAPPADG